MSVVGNVPSKKIEKIWILERFGIYLNIILPYKMSVPMNDS